MQTKRIGIIGYGQIGASLADMILTASKQNLALSFIYDSNPDIAGTIPEDLRLESLENLGSRTPDIVVEAAHPDAVRQYAIPVLKQTDLIIMSVSSLGDPALEGDLAQTCSTHGTSLYIPHGATLGIDGLTDGLSIWESVCITMKKNPKNLNFDAAPDLCPKAGSGAVTLYDGPTRGILPLFPKNVNSHATLGLATLGLDKTRSVLISDPALEESVIEIDARGGGTSIHIERKNPIKGVTGKLTLLSVFESIKNALGLKTGLSIC